MMQISSPNNTVPIIGRVLVESDSDVATPFDLEKQIQPKPLSQRQPGRGLLREIPRPDQNKIR